MNILASSHGVRATAYTIVSDLEEAHPLAPAGAWDAPFHGTKHGGAQKPKAPTPTGNRSPVCFIRCVDIKNNEFVHILRTGLYR